jgi:hypothetical protein
MLARCIVTPSSFVNCFKKLRAAKREALFSLVKDQWRLFKGLQEALFLMLQYPNPGSRMMPAGPALGQIRWLSY